MKKKNKHNWCGGKKGFSMIEVLVAMFISTLIILAATAAFASAFRAQKEAREVQKSIEEAKGTLEYMAKVIRMSSNIKPISGASTAVYMYSKSLGKCILFQYDPNGKKINEIKCTPSSSDEDPCSENNFNADCPDDAPVTTPITDADSLHDAEFLVGGGNIKRITIRMQMERDLNAKLQTTVSTRDYKNVNPIED